VPLSARVRKRVRDRAQAAVWALKGHPEAPQSLNRLVEGAVDREVDRLRDELWDGVEFPSVEGPLPTTPPPDEVARIAALGRAARARNRDDPDRRQARARDQEEQAAIVDDEWVAKRLADAVSEYREQAERKARAAKREKGSE
jgi:hypothetical protein